MSTDGSTVSAPTRWPRGALLAGAVGDPLIGHPPPQLPVKAVSDRVSLPELTRVRLGLRFLLQRLRLLRLGPRDRPAMLDAVVKRLAGLDSGR